MSYDSFKKMDASIDKYIDDPAVLRILIATGADHRVKCKNMKSFFINVIFSGHLDIFKLMLSIDEDLLHDKTRYNFTPLMAAAIYNRVEMAKIFLEIDKGLLDVVCREDRSALMCAVQYGHVEMTKFLLQQGAKLPDRKRNTRSIIHIAAIGGSAELIKMFIDMGFDPTEKDSKQITPLMLAVSFGRIEAVRFLISVSSSVLDAKSSEGETALSIAHKRFTNIPDGPRLFKNPTKDDFRVIIDLLTV